MNVHTVVALFFSAAGLALGLVSFIMPVYGSDIDDMCVTYAGIMSNCEAYTTFQRHDLAGTCLVGYEEFYSAGIAMILASALQFIFVIFAFGSYLRSGDGSFGRNLIRAGHFMGMFLSLTSVVLVYRIYKDDPCIDGTSPYSFSSKNFHFDVGFYAAIAMCAALGIGGIVGTVLVQCSRKVDCSSQPA